MSGIPNVMFLLLDSSTDHWGVFRETRIDVVFVDAAHDFASVLQDLRNILQLPSVDWIVLHDYGVENEKEGIVDGLQVALPP